MAGGCGLAASAGRVQQEVWQWPQSKSLTVGAVPFARSTLVLASACSADFSGERLERSATEEPR